MIQTLITRTQTNMIDFEDLRIRFEDLLRHLVMSTRPAKISKDTTIHEDLSMRIQKRKSRSISRSSFVYARPLLDVSHCTTHGWTLRDLSRIAGIDDRIKGSCLFVVCPCIAKLESNTMDSKSSSPALGTHTVSGPCACHRILVYNQS